LLRRRVRLPLAPMTPFSIALLLLTISYFFRSAEAPTTQAKPEIPADAMVVPICGKPGSHLRRIGWGKFGLQFDIPTRDVRVLGGKVNTDYVRYLIKPKTGQGWLELWFGPYAFSSHPQDELLAQSVNVQERDVVNTKGERMGVDNAGKLQTGEVWRHTFFMISGAEGARYRAGQENVPLFNRIIESACYMPFPKP
jgi:hypothetical protein